MMKQGKTLLILLLSALLCSCWGGIWTGAGIVYDRHNVYKKISNYQLLIEVTNKLFPDKQLRCRGCYVDVAVFNGDVLIVGHLPTPELIGLERQRIRAIKGYKRLYNEVFLGDTSTRNIRDGWITTQIRSQIFTDDSIDPSSFKIVTSDGVVYLMGEVKPDEGKKVIAVARKVDGVQKVVTLWRYYTYQSNKNVA